MKKLLRKYLKENENTLLSINLNKIYDSGYNINQASEQNQNSICIL